MTDDEATGAISHLLTDTVRDVIDQSAYGDWRTIATADAVSLSYGFPDPALFPRDELLDSTEAVLAEEGDEALQYGGGEYEERLESYLVEQERERGIDFETNDLLVTNGATHAIDAVCRAFLNSGDNILVEAPTFMGVLGVFWNYGVDVGSVPVDSRGLDVDALADTLEHRRERGQTMPKLLYTIPDFHNPTGTTLSRERRERLLELASEYDFVILEDGAYSDLYFQEEPPASLATLDETGRVVRVGTFSKTIAPGIRLGWLTAPERVREAARTVTAGGTTTFMRSVVGHYCDTGHLDETLPTLRDTYARKCAVMHDSLDTHMPAGVSWTEPDGGFFTWLTLPDEADADAMLETAAETGVTYLPGSLFYPGENSASGLRLSFTFVSEPKLREGVEALASTIEQSL